MAKAKDLWQTISLKPLTGVFDVRSRPADIPLGGFRWRQGFGTSDENKLCRREGYSRLFPTHLFDNLGDPLSDPNHSGTGSFYHNDDHHFQGATTREPITLIYENTKADGSRQLFDGTSSRVSLLNEATGYWNDIITGLGASGSKWKCATLQDTVVFTNNVDRPIAYSVTGNTTSQITDLNSLTVLAAGVIVSYNGCMFLMNLFQNGGRISNRVRWSDLNLPLSYDPSSPNSIAGFQDLDSGEQILSAKAMLGALIIYTTRSIWQCLPNTSTAPNSPSFVFTKLYTEPKNQIGCLAYPDTLVSTGIDHYYMSRDGIYHYSPYLAEPERIDWIHRADAAIFTNAITKLDPAFCTSPVAESLPSAKELWFSWGTPGFASRNNWTLVINIEQKSADIIDTGFTALSNYRPISSTTQICSQTQVFIGASGKDWALKQIGGVLSRESVTFTNNVQDQDIPRDTAAYSIAGYYSILRGMIPLGLTDRDKIIRRVILDDDVSEQDVPCVWSLRIGHSHKLVDPNDLDDICAPLWVKMGNKPMQCPDSMKVSEMQASNITPDVDTEWPMYERGNFLYFELIVANADGSPAIGGDVCLTRLDFQAMALPQPPG